MPREIKVSIFLTQKASSSISFMDAIRYVSHIMSQIAKTCKRSVLLIVIVQVIEGKPRAGDMVALHSTVSPQLVTNQQPRRLLRNRGPRFSSHSDSK
jgi:hypothetical protein